MGNKRGVVEIQFNWIFVAIAGVLILAFFLNIASGVRKNAKMNFERDAVMYFDEIFTGVQGSENTEQALSFPGVEVKFINDGKDKCHYYTIGSSGIMPQSIENLPVFSPSTIKGSFLSYALGWDMPFRGSYFLFLSSPQIAYIFISGRGTNQLYEEMPRHLTKKTVGDASDFRNQNYHSARLVSANLNPAGFSIHSSAQKMRLSSINIIPDDPGNIYAGGRVEYYAVKNSRLVKEGDSFYMDKATLFAAIYAESLDAYECNLAKALERYNRVASVLAERTAILRDNIANAACRERYSSASEMISSLERLSRNAPGREGFREMRQVSDSLNSVNNELNGLSCPALY